MSFPEACIKYLFPTPHPFRTQFHPPPPPPHPEKMSEQTQTLPNGTIQLAPRTGTAFHLHKGQRLTVLDPPGTQVSGLVAFAASDVREALSNGRTFDYADKLYLTTGAALYSNRSNAMLRIVADTTVGTYDAVLARHVSHHLRRRGSGTRLLWELGVCFGEVRCRGGSDPVRVQLSS